MTTKTTADTFLSHVRKSGLIAPDQLIRLLEDFRERNVGEDARRLADQLVAAEALTRWQADKLLVGRHSGFFLGKYRLLSLLGKGGMSSVYLAEHVLMRRRCAIKVLPTHRVNDTSYLGRFHREARAVASLDHFNIVRAYDVDQETQRNKQIHFLVMEYVEGQSLLDMVHQAGPLDFVRAADYVRQSAAGLAHAHAAGMVHRDVKPGNLLVEANGIVKILDLGLARFFREEDKSLTVAHDEKVLGTADYLAPEQARDSHAVDARADIYSLGCTFYFLVTGHPPFSEGTLAQRLLAHQVLDPPPITADRPDTPAELVQIIERMMAKDPADRFQDVQEVADVLVDWLCDHAGDEWRRRNPGLSGSGPAGSAARRATEAEATAINLPSAEETRTSGLAAPLETAKTRDSGKVQGGAREGSAPKVTKPRVSPAESSADDNSLAMFLTAMSDSPAAAPVIRAPDPVEKPASPDKDVAAGDRAPEPGNRHQQQRKARASDSHPGRKPDVHAAVPVAQAVFPVAGTPPAQPVRRPANAPPVEAPLAATPIVESQPETLLELPAVQAVKPPRNSPPTEVPVATDFARGAAARRAQARRKPGAQAGDRWPKFPKFPDVSRRTMLIGCGLAGAVVFGGIVLAVVGPSDPENGTGSSSGRESQQPQQVQPVRDPRKLLGKDIRVGPAGAFKAINEAVEYVREHFRPNSRSGRQVIRVAGGLTYAERLDLSGGKSGEQGKGFPDGVRIVCDDPERAILDPVGGDPVVRLDGVQHFRLEGFEIRGNRPTAVELTGFLEGTQLRNLEIADFGQVGIHGRGAQGAGSVGSQRNELVLQQIEFRSGGATAVGLRLDGETNRVGILDCRFLQPLATGVEFIGSTRFVELRGSIFANLDVGVRFTGSSELTSVKLAHDTFFRVSRGVVFAEMPQPSSHDLAFHRNLFDQIETAEVIVESGFDQRRFDHSLAAGGPDQNWTTRNATFPPGAIDLFTLNGRKGAAVEFMATDTGHPRFLAPTPGSPHANVPAIPGSGLQNYIGAVAP